MVKGDNSNSLGLTSLTPGYLPQWYSVFTTETEKGRGWRGEGEAVGGGGVFTSFSYQNDGFYTIACQSHEPSCCLSICGLRAVSVSTDVIHKPQPEENLFSVAGESIREYNYILASSGIKKDNREPREYHRRNFGK